MNKSQLIGHLKKQGFSEKTIKAFEKVKREDFISPTLKSIAYTDMPLPIAETATISQPYTIAFMLDKLELKKGNKVLEIGSGSGYVLALINKITNSKTYGVEIIKSLTERSKKVLKNNKNIKVITKSGKQGLPKYAPYDRILISAACPDLGTAKNLAKQLKENGIIVASVQYSIVRIKKQKGKITTEEYPGFVFVPLVDK